MFEVTSKNRIRLTRGDSFYATVSMRYKLTGQKYVPAVGDSIRFALKKTYSDATPLITKIIPNDTLLLELSPQDTENMAFGEYVYDIELTKADGDVDTFIAEAIFELLPEVE